MGQVEIGRRAFLAGIAGAAAAAKFRVIDTHTHFYDPTRPQGVPWPPKSDAVLYRPVLPREFARLTAPFGVAGTVVIEAGTNWLEDNQWVLDLAAENPIIVGFIGNLDARAPEFAANLTRFTRNPLFRGIRLNGRNLAGIVESMKRMADARLTLDVIGGSLSDMLRLHDAVPGLTIVIDHLPFAQPADPALLREAGRRPEIYAKVSNVLHAGRPDLGGLDEVYSAFGPNRVIYGSNWPVSDKINGPYAEVFRAVEKYFAAKGTAERYFRSNSKAAYRWVER